METGRASLSREHSAITIRAKSSEQTKEKSLRRLAHEMRHQWLFDLVTMAWWDNLWLTRIGFLDGTKATDNFNPQWHIWCAPMRQKQRAMTTDALAATIPSRQPFGPK